MKHVQPHHDSVVTCSVDKLSVDNTRKHANGRGLLLHHEMDLSTRKYQSNKKVLLRFVDQIANGNGDYVDFTVLVSLFICLFVFLRNK